MPELTQESRFLQIGKIGSHQFVATSLQGTECISEPFRFTVQLASTDLEVDCKDVLGKDVACTVYPDTDSTRHFHGRVLNFSSDRVVEFGETQVRLYEAEIVPWWWLTKFNSNCRVFQEKTGPQIIEQVLKDSGFTDYKLSLKGTYAKQDYCIQYQESDYAFASRLMEHYGIFYYFLHEDARHTMVLGDAVSAYGDADVKEMPFRETDDDSLPAVYSWRRQSTVAPAKATLADYNFETPATALEATEKTKLERQSLENTEHYEFPGAFLKAADGKPLAVARVERYEADAVVIFGTSRIPAAAAGAKFKLIDYPVKAESDQKFAFLTVNHQAQQPLFASASLASSETEGYSNSFQCVPASVPFRPARTTSRPLMTGPHSAKVVGGKNQEILTDKYGRVKIQFPWDREGKYDDKSSCFVRVAQSWAGSKRGFLFTPRVGDEVLVEFMNGDPDRPIVTGSVYNADNLPPWDPAAKSTVSGIKTFSTDKAKAKNFNELSFDDKIGKEKVYFHAERDFVRVVENNDELKIGFDAKDEGNQTVDIFNDRVVTIDKGKDTLHIKSGDRVMNIDKGDHVVTIKQGDHKVAIKAGQQSTEAAKAITFKVGPSMIKIDPQGVTIEAPKVSLLAQLKAEIKGTLVDVVSSGVTTVKGGLVQIN